ncbi:hypothetical protein MRX96_040186 [Rhipicephalus microplus]
MNGRGMIATVVVLLVLPADISSVDGGSWNLDTEDSAMFTRWQASEEYRDHFKPGVYVCAVCGNELFESDSKFAH